MNMIGTVEIRICPACIAMLFAGMVLASIPETEAWASPILACKIEQGGETFNLKFEPVADPYQVKAVDIGGNFRFKAVVMGDKLQVEYIKLYTYYLRNNQAILLHEGVYHKPGPQKSPDYANLTGINFIYSPALERELKYGCALIEVAP